MTKGRSADRHVVAAVSIVLSCGTVADAQSALDGFDPGANGSVNALAVQPDGKILVGRSFTGLGGGPARRPVTESAGVGVVPSFVQQFDGKTLVGGGFTGLGGGTGATPRNGIGRLDADGSVDGGFNPGASDFVTRSPCSRTKRSALKELDVSTSLS